MSGVGLGAAEILAQHWMDEDQDCVKCRLHFVKIADFAAHQIDALKAAGYAVVKLPTPDRMGHFMENPDTHTKVWADVNPSEPRVCAGVPGYHFQWRSVSNTRAFAAALLAAADAAEADR